MEKVKLTLKEEVVKRLTPVKAIRVKCLDCSGGQPKEVRLCPHGECSLFLYRFGKNPNRKGMGIAGRSFEKNNDLSAVKSEKKGILESV